ncbi:MAG: PxKF domain-containing protein, partial [Acidimicrobiales bacterium]
ATLSAVTGPLASYGLGSQTASCSYTDSGGLTATATATYAIVDTTDPTFSCSPADTAWHATDQSSSCTASDNVALASPAAFSLTTSVAAGTEDANASTGTAQVCDVAGNCVTAGPVSGWMIDKLAPTAIAFSSTLSGNYYFGSVPPAPTCTAVDGGSGLASCVVTGYSAAVGAHTLTATATDNVGNADTATTSYTVLAWTVQGFYQPVDMGTGVVNTVKGGSTVPLKFEVFAGPTELTATSVVTAFTQQKVPCAAGLAEDPVDVTSTGGTTLRYDVTAGQFIQNWQTPRSPGTCYNVTVKFQDGSSISAQFKLR